MAPPNVLIFGATGLIGEHITNSILNHTLQLGSVSIFTSEQTLQTKSKHIDHLKKRHVTIICGSLDSKDEITKAYNSIDVVVSCVGRQAIHKQIDLIHWADQHPDVKHFFPSEYGTDIEYGPSSATEKPHQQKLKVREALKAVNNLNHTYIVVGPYGDGNPGLYLSAMPQEMERMGTFDVKQRRAVLLGDGEGDISLTTMRDVGEFVVGAILHLDQVKNRALKVNSFTSTPKAILREFEQQTDSTWQQSFTSLAQLKKLEDDAWKAGNSLATVATLRRIWTEGGTVYDHRDNAVIGVSDSDVDTLESAVAEAIRVQTACV